MTGTVYVCFGAYWLTVPIDYVPSEVQATITDASHSHCGESQTSTVAIEFGGFNTLIPGCCIVLTGFCAGNTARIDWSAA
jgi:hypothetical protein